MSIRNTIILLLIVAAASAGLTRYFFPQVEVKNVEVTKEVIKNDIKTIVKEVTRPDGSKEIVTEIVDKSTKKETTKSETTIAAKPQWMFNVGARMNVSDRDLYYDLQAHRRILGPFYLGASVSTDKTIGVSIGMEY